MINQLSKRFYEFDSFRIDLDERRLMRSDEVIPLTPKVFDVLLALIENRGRTISKDELIDRVWADTFVEDGNLNRNISTLRKVLGENSHDPHYIKTVPKRGYRFEADVREVIEEAEEIRVERVTNYHLAITDKQESVTRHSVPSLLSTWRWPLAAASVVIVVLVSAWAITREPAQAAQALTAEKQRAEAYELYREGRELWQNRSVGGLHSATLLLEQAVNRDPGFALAHAALADAYAFDGTNWKKADAAANEALRLDPTIGQPHATIGFTRTFWHWQLKDAESHFKRSIELSPDYATGRQWYALNLIARGNIGAALAQMQRALELEPQSVAINADMCQVLYFARKYDDAIGQCEKAIEIDPNFLSAHTYLYEIFTAKRMFAEARDAFFRVSELDTTTPVDPTLLTKLKQADAFEAFWRTRVEMLKRPAQSGGYGLAKYHARLGETEQSIGWLEKARESRDFEYIYFVADPAFEKVAGDARYNVLREVFLR